MKWMSLLLLLIWYGQAQSASFGQSQVGSHLGEPLSLTIPLQLTENEASGRVDVALASFSDYKKLEQTIPESYGLLRVDVNKKSDTSWVVSVSSKQALDEPFLSIVLKVQRGRGSYFKKVDVLLSPRAMATLNQRKRLASVEDGFVQKPSPTMNTGGRIQTDGANGGIGVAPQLALPTTSGWARRSSYGPVQRGDSLSEIAYRLRKDKRWSNYQVMLALFNANPDAFVNGNMNNLKKGSFLQVPDDAQVQAFVSSQSFAKLKASVKKQTKKKQSVEVQVNQKKAKQSPRFRKKVSLGLSERLNEPINDAIMMEQLKKLEPLYKQAMATDLRVDGIGTKVDELSEKVRILNAKVDTLTKYSIKNLENTSVKSESSYGWWWFFVLLLINVILILIIIYKRQRNVWQKKLDKALNKGAYVQDTQAPFADYDTMSPDFEDNQHFEEDSVVEKVEAVVKTSEDIPPSEPLVSKQEDLEDTKDNEVFVDHIAGFEHAIHRQDWVKAELHYEEMFKNIRNQPRIQVMYVEMLHRSKRIQDRNNKLLDLFETYNNTKWQRFCSLFDEKIWEHLQDENIISFTGAVRKSGVEASNKAADEADAILSISKFDLHDDEGNEVMFEPSESKAEDDMDKTYIMDAESMKKWRSNLGESHGIEAELKDVIDNHDEQKWGKVDIESGESEMLEVDFDVEETSAVDPYVDSFDYTEVDIELTDELKESLRKGQKPN